MITAVQSKDQVFERVHAHQSALKQFGAAKLGLFGSFVRGEQQPESDYATDLFIITGALTKCSLGSYHS